MYYSSLYHPYNSPYHELIPSPLSVRQRIAQLQTLDNYTKLAQSEAIVKANEEAIARQNYTRSLLINSKIESDLYQKMYGNTIDEVKFNVAQQNVEYNYLKKLEELRREREMLQNSGRINFYPGLVEQKLKNNDERYMSDDELVNYYQSGARGQDYHYEIYKQLQNNKNSAKNVGDTYDVSYKKDRIYNQKPNIARSNKEQKGQNTRNQIKIAKQVQRSYVDELNQISSNQYGTVQQSRNQMERGATIDVIRNQKEKEDSSLANTFYCSPKKKSNNINKTVIQDSIRNNKSKTKRTKKLNSTFTKPYTITFNSVITELAIQKINNRLKVSGIVYKDSKLRHKRHEGQHLFNTFQNEIKGRMEVKDKINNNPAVLKKHNMVVSSR